MKRHLKRFGWFYLTLGGLIAWPILLLRQQTIPPIDLPSLRRLATTIHTEFVRQHPECQVRAIAGDPVYAELCEQKTDEPKDYRFYSMLGGDAASTAAMQPDLERIGKRYAQTLKRLDALSSSGVVYTHMLPEPGSQTSKISDVEQLFPSLNLMYIARLRCAQADAAIRQGHWDEALRLLESGARLGDPFRYTGLIGHLTAVAMRGAAYGGYNTLLHAGAPPEVERAALASLVRLRRSEPVLDEWTWLGEMKSSYNYLIFLGEAKPQDRKDDLSRQLTAEIAWQAVMFQAANALALQRDRIKDPALRARAGAISNHVSAEALLRGDLKAIYSLDRLRWTAVPATRKWLQEMLKREPWVRQEVFAYEFNVLPADVKAKLAPWTMLLLSANGNPHLQEAIRGGKMIKTEGRLLEAAFATRLFHERTGAWPRELKDLAGFYPLSDDTATTTRLRGLQLDTGAFMPLRIAELPMDGDRGNALWSGVLPLRNFYAQLSANALRPDGTLDVVMAGGPTADWVKEPVRMSAMEEALRAHPALVAQAQALMTTDTVNQGMDPASREKYYWQPLTPDFARQVTEAGDKTTGAQQGATPLQALRLKAKLRTPEKAVVIWSPGPDGKDDGGQICYDPTNGSVSRGDLLAFPEKY